MLGEKTAQEPGKIGGASDCCASLTWKKREGWGSTLDSIQCKVDEGGQHLPAHKCEPLSGRVSHLYMPEESYRYCGTNILRDIHLNVSSRDSGVQIILPAPPGIPRDLPPLIIQVALSTYR